MTQAASHRTRLAPFHKKEKNSCSGKPRIAIVMSTFNGERYLPQLLESLESQTWRCWDLWVRDDGSTDTTVEILEVFARRLSEKGGDRRMVILEGENIGIVGSFLYLLSLIEDDFDGYAFCDQDDIWLPEKLSRAVSSLLTHSTSEENRNMGIIPFLYHSRQMLLDDSGGDAKKSPLPVHTGFANALIQNQVVGCTMVINQALKNLVAENLKFAGDQEPFSAIIMHDWWCYLIASGFGAVFFDDHPTIRFRRHQESTTPVSANTFRAFKKRFHAIQKRSWSVAHVFAQVEQFTRLYMDNYWDSANQTSANREFSFSMDKSKKPSDWTLSDEKRRQLDSFLKLKQAGFLQRLCYFFTSGQFRAGLLDTLFFRLLILFGRY